MGKEPKEKEPRYGTVNLERRKHPRFSVDLPIEYWQISESERHPGRLVNIGEGGLLLYISDQIEIGQNLELKVFYSGFKLHCTQAQVQVVWKDFLPEKDDCYRIGVKFVDISAEDMDKFKNFLDYLRNIKTPSEINVPSKVTNLLSNVSTKKSDS